MVKFLSCNIQGCTEVKGVKMILRLIHHHHNVIGRLVIHQQLTVSIRNDTTRGIFYLLQEGIRVGTFLIVVACNLKRKETDDIDNHYQGGYPSNHISSIV